MKGFTSLTIACLISMLIGCQSSPEKTYANSKAAQKITQKANANLQGTELNQYQSYFLDSSVNLENWELAIQYIQNTQRKFDTTRFFNGKKLVDDRSDSAYLLGIEFAKSMAHFRMRQIRLLPKTNLSIALLGGISPFASEITFDQKLALYNTFPAEIRNNDFGKKALKNLYSNRIGTNLGRTLTSFNLLKVYDSSGLSVGLGSVINNNKTYTIIIFGASWCKPCVVQERGLNKTSIDSSNIEIIGLSVDTDKEKFSKYVKNENFFWPVYRLEDGTDNPLMKYLEFNAIPRNFLLDKNSKIIGENVDVVEILKLAKL